jgi:hypothetical protein
VAVWEAADDHPYRAFQINSAGLIEAFGGARKVSTEHQSYTKAYYCDQRLWRFASTPCSGRLLKSSCVEALKGLRTLSLEPARERCLQNTAYV